MRVTSTIARKMLAYFYFGASNIDRQIELVAKFTGYTVVVSCIYIYIYTTQESKLLIHFLRA